MIILPKTTGGRTVVAAGVKERGNGDGLTGFRRESPRVSLTGSAHSRNKGARLANNGR